MSYPLKSLGFLYIWIAKGNKGGDVTKGKKRGKSLRHNMKQSNNLVNTKHLKLCFCKTNCKHACRIWNMNRKSILTPTLLSENVVDRFGVRMGFRLNKINLSLRSLWFMGNYTSPTPKHWQKFLHACFMFSLKNVGM